MTSHCFIVHTGFIKSLVYSICTDFWKLILKMQYSENNALQFFTKVSKRYVPNEYSKMCARLVCVVGSGGQSMAIICVSKVKCI